MDQTDQDTNMPVCSSGHPNTWFVFVPTSPNVGMVQKQQLSFCSPDSTKWISYSEKFWESQRKALQSAHDILVLHPKKGTEMILIENKAFCLSERIQGSPQQSEMTPPTVHSTAFVFNGELGQGCTFEPSLSQGVRHISSHFQWTLLLPHCWTSPQPPDELPQCILPWCSSSGS